MTIKKKKEKNAEDIEDIMKSIISRGGAVSADHEDLCSPVITKSLCLRMPLEMLNQIDSSVKKRIGLPRTVWILEAIQEKLKKEES
jgi:hypothetical protein